MNTPNYIKELQGEITSLVCSKYGEIGLDVSKDVKHFLDQNNEKLLRWTMLLEKNEISKDEFGLLIYSLKDLFVMDVLHKAGVSKIGMARLTNSIMALVIKKASETLSN